MKACMLDVLKWWLIIAFGGVVFYLVCPKFEFNAEGQRYRVNRITGELAKLISKEWVRIDRKKVEVVDPCAKAEAAWEKQFYEEWDRVNNPTKRELTFDENSKRTMDSYNARIKTTIPCP